jgi:peptide chain release factor 1
MKLSIANKLTQLSERLVELDRLLMSETVTSDLDNYRKLTREHAEITPVVELFKAYQQTEKHIAEAQAMLNDAEMKEFADAEIREGKEKIIQLEADLQKELLPKDPNDERNIFLEIRAGTGGDESALFSGDLFRMYSRFAERNRWQVEVISQSVGEVGGYKEIIARVIGQGAYSKLKFESGGHRVQRKPKAAFIPVLARLP